VSTAVHKWLPRVRLLLMFEQYFLSKTLAELPVQLVFSFMFGRARLASAANHDCKRLTS
jgi:hypothetical protein